MHLTVRMAWHDNNWDGRVCQDPQSNTYCTGANSLLSARIERKKNTKLEQCKRGQYIEDNFESSSVPPCYWSINAFSCKGFNVEHQHAFYENDEPISKISDYVKPNSIFTWPFKLSYVHGKENKKAHGNYPPDLDRRICKFIQLFTPKQSIIFFYANYDNPVSADERKYLLLGCSRISELPTPQHFPFSEEELQKWRTRDNSMKNFPTMNWALQFTHDSNCAVLLPYKEYLDYAENYPADAVKLDEMKVVIEEDSLIGSFKYVAMDIDDDKCLYLLYKIRKSIKKINEHNEIVIQRNLIEEEKRIEELIQSTWQMRGIYPSLDKVLYYFLEDEQICDGLAKALRESTTPSFDLLNLFRRIADDNIPEELKSFENELLDLVEMRLFKKNLEGIVQLSLFNLTSKQIEKIIEDNRLLGKVAENPYVLYEEYVHNEGDMDTPELQDEPIDIYKLDIGMIPDRNYVKRHRKIQHLAEDSPQRIRSVYINHLKLIGQLGHCYESSRRLINAVKDHPLIYKQQKVKIDEQGLLDLDTYYRDHFTEKLHTETSPGESDDFYYLAHVHQAEQDIEEAIDKLICRQDYGTTHFDTESHITESLQSDPLSKIITEDDEKSQFINERRILFNSIFRKSFFLLTGKPGTGKTFEVSKVVEHLARMGEHVEILAPTGKAVLRLTENIHSITGLERFSAKTIDRFLYEHFPEVMNNYWHLEENHIKNKFTVENLILDECSMLDLEKLHILFSVIKFTDKYPKRIILVGDENQLPPIGFGKPFHDMITHVLKNHNLSESHYVNLVTNCRQENDDKILDLAEAFTDKSRYYEKALSLASSTGQVSDGLFIERWSDANSLYASIERCINKIFKYEKIVGEDEVAKLNKLFGLYENGFVNNTNLKFRENLDLEALQLLSPYQTGFYGTLSLNHMIQKRYRSRDRKSWGNYYFRHSDKMIQVKNWYVGKGNERKLLLSNGSIGIVTVNSRKAERKYYFSELSRPLSNFNEEENCELAYAISVHRSQGSDFTNVLLIIPRKKSLLSKELIYTALTRSKFRLFLFIQEDDEDLLFKARETSHLLTRNTSIFKTPVDNRAVLVPDPCNKPVKSRAEYIIYKTLQSSGLTFQYEENLPLKFRDYDIHPDFTIRLANDRTIYWEHLGMLDVRKYYRDWQKRTEDYKDHGIFDDLVTTDDLNGIRHEKIEAVIEAIRTGQLQTTHKHRLSSHHYELY